MCFEPTYKELKQEQVKKIEETIIAFRAYLQGIETQINLPILWFVNLFRAYLQGIETLLHKPRHYPSPLSFEPTYKELKPLAINTGVYTAIKFRAYLQGIETCSVAKKIGLGEVFRAYLQGIETSIGGLK